MLTLSDSCNLLFQGEPVIDIIPKLIVFLTGHDPITEAQLLEQKKIVNRSAAAGTLVTLIYLLV